MESDSESSTDPHRRRNINNSFSVSDSDTESFHNKIRSKVPKKNKNPQNVMSGISNDSSESSSSDSDLERKFDNYVPSNSKINNPKKVNKKVKNKKQGNKIASENKKPFENLTKKNEEEKKKYRK